MLLVSPAIARAQIDTLNGQTGTTQTFANDTNVQINSSGNVHNLIWNGTLSVARGGTGSSSFISGSIPFSNGTALIQDSINFKWDDINDRLTVDNLTVKTGTSLQGLVRIPDGKDLRFIQHNNGQYGKIEFRDNTSIILGQINFDPLLEGIGINSLTSGISLLAGGNTDAGAGNINLTGGTFVPGGSTGSGGNVKIFSGSGTGGGNGGNVNIQSGNAGDAGGSPKYGGLISIITGTGDGALGGSGGIVLATGHSIENGFTGEIHIKTGNSSGTKTPGGIDIIPGNGTANSNGGATVIAGGDGRSGGPVTIRGGAATTNSFGGGGPVFLFGGQGVDDGGGINMTGGNGTNFYGGNINLTAGNGGQTGGGIRLQAGTGSITDGSVIIEAGKQSTGGNIELYPGSGTVNIHQPTTSNYAAFNVGLLTATRNYVFPDASGTIPLLESDQTFTGLNKFEDTDTTIYVGSSSLTGCIALGDSDGSGITWITANNGTISATSSKPGICQ